MDLIYIYDAIGSVAIVAALLYLLFYFIFRKSIISFSDPLNLQLLMFSAYLAGAVILGLYFSVNATYYLTMALMGLYIATGAIILNWGTKPVRCPSLNAAPSTQIFFAYGITLCLAINVIANYIFGFIPLFHGTESRALAGEVPIASLQVFNPVLMSIALYLMLFTESSAVKRIASAGLLLGIVAVLLGGSKSAIFIVIACMLTYDYYLHLKSSGEQCSETQKALAHSIKRIRTWLIAVFATTCLALPLYLVAIGAGNDVESSMIQITVRLFGGFDGLVAVAQSDINYQDTEKLNLLQMYFYPVYKKLGVVPEFKTIGSYIIYLTTGDYARATTSLYPNSNFALELLFSINSLMATIAIMFLVSASIFFIRKLVLQMTHWNIFHIFLLALIVTSPISMLIDGAYFINLLYFEALFYLLMNSLLNLFRMASDGRLIYVFY